MRPFYAVAGLVALGLGLAGWATLGQAQTRPGPRPPVLPDPAMPERPAKGAGPRAQPADEPDSGRFPAIRSGSPDVTPAPGPVRVLEPIDTRDIGLPAGQSSVVKPAVGKDPTPGGIKPIVFIPNPDGPPKPQPAAQPTGPAARQEPAVSLEWAGPTVLKVGVPAEYTLTARNTSPIPLHKVIVQVKVPSGAKLAGTEPKAEGTEAVLVWDHGVLAPRQEKVVKLRLVPPATGELLCQAWVTFTGSAALKVQVREPKLAVAVHAPEKVTAGDQAVVTLTVSNPGDHPADGVRLAVALGAGLEAAGGKTAIDVGTLAAGEAREVKVPCVARAGGAQKCEVTAEGDGGLSATGSATVTVIQPRLEVELAGPKLRYLERKATYATRVTNSGDAPAADVVVTEAVPTGFKFVSAEAGGRYDAGARTVKWSVGELGAGQARDLKCELVASGLGDQTHTVVAGGARGVRAEKAVVTKVEGLSALSMQVADTDDPVEVGAETSYEVRVTNTGSKDETEVKLVCTIPPQMKLKAARGPGKFEVVGNEVVFEPVKSLEPRSDLTYRVTVTAQTKGDARFKATLTAGGLSEPVIKQESTRVYAD
jgi:Domain of unknown function DUF11